MPVIEPPSPKERLLFLGINGSGKSVLASQMLAGYPRYVALDSKGDLQLPGARIIRTLDPMPWRLYGGGRVIFRPKPELNRGPVLNELLRREYIRATKEGKKRPFVVYVDEALYLAQQSKAEWLSALAVSGRSLKVGLWVASQRPKWIPVAIRSEFWRLYVFYSQYQEDWKEIYSMTGGLITTEMMQALGADFSFYEVRRNPGGKLTLRHLPAVALADWQR